MIAALVVYVLLGGGWAWFQLNEDKAKLKEALEAANERHGENTDKWVLGILILYLALLWPISIYIRYIGIGKP